MKSTVFHELSRLLTNSESIHTARTKFPDIAVDTLIAIRCQEQTRRVRQTHHKHRQPHLIRQYIIRYVNGEDILSISTDYDINPCLLARILLEHLFGLTKQQISECLKDPCRLPEDKVRSAAMNISKSCNSLESKELGKFEVDLPVNSRHISLNKLQMDLYKCVDHDNATSPYIELIRQVTGIEYEAYLYSKLKELGIPFQTEHALRVAGFSKTPDVKLEVPIGIQGRVVNWIDSKASFGDEYSHKHQASQQFQRYVNRFGPGLVIYWFGFVDELNIHNDVLLLDRFPATHEIYCLSSIKISVKP